MDGTLYKESKYSKRLSPPLKKRALPFWMNKNVQEYEDDSLPKKSVIKKDASKGKKDKKNVKKRGDRVELDELCTKWKQQLSAKKCTFPFESKYDVLKQMELELPRFTKEHLKSYLKDNSLKVPPSRYKRDEVDEFFIEEFSNTFQLNDSNTDTSMDDDKASSTTQSTSSVNTTQDYESDEEPLILRSKRQTSTLANANRSESQLASSGIKDKHHQSSSAVTPLPELRVTNTNSSFESPNFGNLEVSPIEKSPSLSFIDKVGTQTPSPIAISPISPKPIEAPKQPKSMCNNTTRDAKNDFTRK